MSYYLFLSGVLAAFSSLALAQPPTPVRRPLSFAALAHPPIPVDNLEIVSAAEAVQNTQQRLDAIALLKTAHELSNVRAQPYDLKTSFVTLGGLTSEGTWTLEDIARGRAYRWTAQGPNYSSVNLYPDSVEGVLYSNQSAGVIPLRLAQVRDAIFFAYQMLGPQASIRTATASLNGVEEHCVLTVIGAGGQAFSGARNWEESEYCVDAKTGLLSIYSPVPGLYVHYDYASAARFHGKVIPGSFTITEEGRKIIEATTLSVTEPVDSKDPIFNPAGLLALGVGRTMNPPARLRSLVSAPGQPLPASNSGAAVQVVVLHGSISPDGHLVESEVVATSDAALNQAALDRATAMNLATGQNQPGATPQSREMFFTFEFVTH